MLADDALAQAARADTERWLTRAVIGLNLCPFAKAVHVKGQIHTAVVDGRNGQALAERLRQELLDLTHIDPQVRDTTLLVMARGLEDFLDYNDFLDVAEIVLADCELEGVLQIASFHPQYQFAGTAVDDVSNCSNRSPYPTLHLIREASLDRAVQAFPEAERIYQVNMALLERMGWAGWRALDVAAHGVKGEGAQGACAFPSHAAAVGALGAVDRKAGA